MSKTQDIFAVVWNACNTFRGLIDPSQYKDYILTMLFVKYLSDLKKEKLAHWQSQYPDNPDKVARRMGRERFHVPQAATFDYLYAHRNEDNIGQLIDEALALLEKENKGKLEGVFRNISFNNNNLGSTKDRNARLKNLLADFNNERLDLRPSVLAEAGEADIMGDVYEYLISKFAGDAGKKAGEFYTPAQVATLLAKLVQAKAGERIYDPTCGSGSLLLKVAKEIGSKNLSLFGQEVNGSTYALARMNMFLHSKDNANIQWGDVLRNPLHKDKDELKQFDVVVANPPFSLQKWGHKELQEDVYNRFPYGLPPKSKGDYAFISHMIASALPQKGRVGVVVPHGVLFRGSSEGKIRKQLIEQNYLKAVVGLPANLFFGTGIPAAILLFDLGRTAEDKVLFIDASREYEAGKNQNTLRDTDIEKIMAAYEAFDFQDKYAYAATLDEIRENDYNLNIPRYVDTFEEEALINLQTVDTDLQAIDQDIAQTENTLTKLIAQLDFHYE